MKNWVLRIQRLYEEKRADRIRTKGLYKIYHEGNPTWMAGMTIESAGPGDNSHAGNHKCVEAGTYPLLTQNGERYRTIGYNHISKAYPRPGIHTFFVCQ